MVGMMACGGVSLRAVSVRNFGATGDGSQDVTAAFQEAILVAGRGDGVLEIPSGRYLITADLEIPEAVRFTGEGNEKTVVTSGGRKGRFLVMASRTSFHDIGFEKMVEPIGLVSRPDYVLENLRFERCRFERMEAKDSNRGVIGLSSGRIWQRSYRIRKVSIIDCLFRTINANAVNIRADISDVEILGSQFLDIEKPPDGDPRENSYAIRLGGYVEKTNEIHDKSSNQGRYRIERNVIRGMKKSSKPGSLKAMLIYGDHNLIQNNIIEAIDGGEAGEDTNALYIRGAFNRILNNQIRDIRGADDDGALCFKGEMALGSVGNIIADNQIENIRGMSAVEVSTSGLRFENNQIEEANTRGFYHRSGKDLTVTGNRFVRAKMLIRSSGGEVLLKENSFIDSGISLGQRRSHSSQRDVVTIERNHFSTSLSVPVIRMENDVKEKRLLIQHNSFLKTGRDSGEDSAASLLELAGSGEVQMVELMGNRVELEAAEEVVFRLDPDTRGQFTGNSILVGDLRAPLLESGLSRIEENRIEINTGAGKPGKLSALFVMTSGAGATPRVFRRNEIVNHAEERCVTELIAWEDTVGKLEVSGNQVEGCVGAASLSAPKDPGISGRRRLKEKEEESDDDDGT